MRINLMVDAHMNCVNMGRTLADASAIVTRLDIFISFIILVIVLLLWLLITGIATTTVLVTIVTPLLALAFIFGDSTKQFFQGIIFCFGTHAFDVGDRCILDDTELEVKRMGILTTTFIKIGTAEKRMYPNSVLATKAIINLGWQPDPSDMVELTLDYSTTLTDWQMLEKKVELFFKDPQQKEFFQSSHEMMMKESGDKIKVTIRFKHVLNVKEMTHGECLLKKNRQRSKILTQVNHFLGHTLPTTTRNDENGGSVNSQVFPRIDVHQPSITTEIAEFNPYILQITEENHNIITSRSPGFLEMVSPSWNVGFVGGGRDRIGSQVQEADVSGFTSERSVARLTNCKNGLIEFYTGYKRPCAFTEEQATEDEWAVERDGNVASIWKSRSRVDGLVARELRRGGADGKDGCVRGSTNVLEIGGVGSVGLIKGEVGDKSWSLLAFTVTAAYFAALYVCICLFKIIQIINMIRRAKTNLYIWVGLFPSVSLLFYFGFILAAWVGYFGTERGLKNASFPHPEAFDHVTWICISLFVGSILWLSKTRILLMWSAEAIYRRFEPRILMTTVKFFFLGLLAGDFFLSTIITNMELLEDRRQKTSISRTILCQNVSQSLTSLAKNVRPLQEEGLPKLLEALKTIPGTTDILDELVKLLDCRDLDDRNFKSPKLKRRHGCANRTPDSPRAYRNNIAKVLQCIVREQCPTAAENEITFDDLKRWMGKGDHVRSHGDIKGKCRSQLLIAMVDAHMNCVNMGRTLADASAIVTQLDIFMSFVISVVVVLLWLLISGIATTKILVTIGTPLLALTFIFGESAKLFFQGIIFCFGTNSFDVGDRCILDQTEESIKKKLVVEKIRILTTTFITIGTEERRMYPNSVLATKAIVNQGWQPDPSDTVELLLDLSTLPAEWKTLEEKIDEFFKDDQQKGYFQSWHEVKMKETGDKVKVTIHFKHVLNVKEMTHGECLHKKDKQHSIILRNITQLVDPKLLIGSGNIGTLVNSHGLPRYQLGQTSTTTDQSGGMF
ncbi:hypothetical protein V2J09_008070 [Rumex salicifolius]